MKRFPKPQQSSLPQPDNATPEPVASEFDIVGLLADGGEILRREVKNLLMESSRGKLGATSAKDLVSYLKLLHDLKLDQEKALSSMSDEELDKLWVAK